MRQTEGEATEGGNKPWLNSYGDTGNMMLGRGFGGSVLNLSCIWNSMKAPSGLRLAEPQRVG